MFYVEKRFIVKSCRVMWPQLASAAAAAAFNLDPLPCSSGLWDIWYAGRGAGGGGDCVSSANVSFCFLSGLYYQYSYYYYCVSLAAAHVCVCESVKVWTCVCGGDVDEGWWMRTMADTSEFFMFFRDTGFSGTAAWTTVNTNQCSVWTKGTGTDLRWNLLSLCFSFCRGSSAIFFFFFSPRNPQSDHAWLPG